MRNLCGAIDGVMVTTAVDGGSAAGWRGWQAWQVTGMADVAAQNPEPYKLGMFAQNNRPFVGLVVAKDTLVVDLSRANVGAPATLKALIAGWDAAMAGRLAALAALAAASAKQPPAFSFKATDVKTLPPIADPSVLLNAAVNYQEHAMEMRSQSTVAASAAAVAPRGAGHSRLLEPEARRRAAQPLLLHQGGQRDHGSRRSDPAAARTHPDRLGVRAQHRDRQDGQAREGGAGRRVHLRLHARQRRVRSRRSRRRPPWIGLDRRQEPRHVLPDGACTWCRGSSCRIPRSSRSGSR